VNVALAGVPPSAIEPELPLEVPELPELPVELPELPVELSESMVADPLLDAPDEPLPDGLPDGAGVPLVDALPLWAAFESGVSASSAFAPLDPATCVWLDAASSRTSFMLELPLHPVDAANTAKIPEIFATRA
jgi:hypothetical protein